MAKLQAEVAVFVDRKLYDKYYKLYGGSAQTKLRNYVKTMFNNVSFYCHVRWSIYTSADSSDLRPRINSAKVDVPYNSLRAAHVDASALFFSPANVTHYATGGPGGTKALLRQCAALSRHLLSLSLWSLVQELGSWLPALRIRPPPGQLL